MIGRRCCGGTANCRLDLCACKAAGLGGLCADLQGSSGVLNPFNPFNPKGSAWSWCAAAELHQKQERQELGGTALHSDGCRSLHAALCAQHLAHDAGDLQRRGGDTDKGQSLREG